MSALRKLVHGGVLGEKALEPDYGETRMPIKSKLDRVTNQNIVRQLPGNVRTKAGRSDLK